MLKPLNASSQDGHVVSHDTFNHFLTRQSLPPEALWNEVEPFVEKHIGWLVIDDIVIDKVHFKKIDL